MASSERAGGDVATVAEANELTQGTTAPASPVEGDVWSDTAVSGKPVLKQYDGTGWVEVGTSKVEADAFEWMTKIAQLYTMHATNIDQQTNSVRGDMEDAGWVIGATNLVVSPNTGDLNSRTDATPGHWELNSDGKGISSPEIIGGWATLRQIARLLGASDVATIRIDIVARFTATASRNDSYVGLSATQGTGEADGISFHTGATNFQVRVSAADNDTGIAVDTSWHEWSIIIDVAAVTADFEIDGVVAASDIALPTDKWPMMVDCSRGASTPNVEVHAYTVEFFD